MSSADGVRTSHRRPRSELSTRPLHRRVSLASAAAASLLMHTLLLSTWWSNVLSPVLGLSVRSDTPSISAVRLERTVMRIEQLPPDDVHTIIDDPPDDPPDDPVILFQTTPTPEVVAVHADPQPASDNRPPRYPGAASRRNWEGRVVLRVAVDVFGAVTAVTVITSSGHELLDQAALEAVSAWRFEPAHDSGVPMAGETDVSVRFELEG